MGFELTISVEAIDVLPRLKDRAGAGRAIARAMDRENQFTVSHIQKDYASFPKDEPTTLAGLRVISNRYRSSIRASKALVTSDGVESSIGSNVVYAAVHEFGYDGPQEVSAHIRRRYKLSSFSFGGPHLNRKLRGQDIFVRAFTRQMHLPARAPIQKGIKDRLAETGAAVSSAIVEFWRGENK